VKQISRYTKHKFWANSSYGQLDSFSGRNQWNQPQQRSAGSRIVGRWCVAFEQPEPQDAPGLQGKSMVHPALHGSQVWTSRELLNRCDFCAQIIGDWSFFG
jgi:hypothetical protein